MRIVHILRAPVGGLFRHVCDLVRVQASLGHAVGIVCDGAGGDRAREVLSSIETVCELGIHRIVMPRMPGPGDIGPLRQVSRIVDGCSPNIVHGHGAKGGLYARMIKAKSGAKTIYTPHGGALHYSWNTPQGAIFLGTEKLLLRRTAGLAFVCHFERNSFEDKIGTGDVPKGVVYNGLWPDEFEPVKCVVDATDLLFIGELRVLKGVDVLIEAVGALNKKRCCTLTIVGDGPDRSKFESQVSELNLENEITFTGALPAREAFRLGKVIIIPSRAESFPYIVLEAIAAHLPIIASRVGGIPEILPDDMLVQPDDAGQLLQAISDGLENPSKLIDEARREATKASKRLSVDNMGANILEFYKTVLNGAEVASSA